MKLEKRFCVKDNRLYYIEENKELEISGTRLSASACAGGGIPPTDLSRLLLIDLPWTQVGCDESSYNEEFLASFRDFLKALEEKGGYAAIIPLADRQPAAGEVDDGEGHGIPDPCPELIAHAGAHNCDEIAAVTGDVPVVGLLFPERKEPLPVEGLSGRLRAAVPEAQLPSK